MRLFSPLGSGMLLILGAIGCNSGPPPHAMHPSHQQVYHHPQQGHSQQIQSQQLQPGQGAMPDAGGGSGLPPGQSAPMQPSMANPQDDMSPQGFGPAG